MIVTAWNNGKYNPTGAGYGLKVRAKDRDKYFDKRWKCISLKLQGKKGKALYVAASINKKSFWGIACRELTQKDIGIWLKQNVRVPWRKGYPPKLAMNHIGSNKFIVRLK